ncbi:hypothetical protein PMAYCL1PPCAC_31799, partial [Pristionchus mayeri]
LTAVPRSCLSIMLFYCALIHHLSAIHSEFVHCFNQFTMESSSLRKLSKLSLGSVHSQEETLSSNTSVFHDPESLSLLEQLPRELLWTIFDFAPESVHNIRLVSRQLRLRVEQYAAQKDNIIRTLTILDKGFRIDKRNIKSVDSYGVDDKEENDPYDLQLRIVPNKLMESVFELRLLIHQHLFDLKNLRKQIHFYGSSAGSSVPKNSESAYILKFNSVNAHDVEIGLKYLAEFIGRQVREVYILLGREWNAMDFVDPLLHGMKFGYMKVSILSLSRDLSNHVLNITRTHGLDEIYLKIINAGALLDPVEMLIELSTLVRTMHVYHNYTQDFLNVANVEWGPVILKMLNNKLDKLRIFTNSGEYLSRQSVDLIVEQVPNIGKQIDLCIPCTRFYEKVLDCTSHDHWVTANGGPRSGSLKVQHISIREREDRELRALLQSCQKHS